MEEYKIIMKKVKHKNEFDLRPQDYLISFNKTTPTGVKELGEFIFMKYENAYFFSLKTTSFCLSMKELQAILNLLKQVNGEK